jgi:hypothetical protein
MNATLVAGAFIGRFGCTGKALPQYCIAAGRLDVPRLSALLAHLGRMNRSTFRLYRALSAF